MIKLPGATQVTEGRRYNYQSSYRAFDKTKPRLVLHTIEGGLSRSVAANHNYPPQLWYSPYRRQVFQTMDLAGPAMSLKHRGGDPETNHRGPCFQVELEGYASGTPTWPETYLKNIAEDILNPLNKLCYELYGTTFLDGEIQQGKAPSDVNYVLASYNSPLRMTWAKWAQFRGVTSHQRVPGNDHWDAGGLDIIKAVSFTSTTANTGEDTMRLVSYGGNVAITDGIMKTILPAGSTWPSHLGTPSPLDAASFNLLLPADRVWTYLNELRDDEAKILGAIQASATDEAAILAAVQASTAAVLAAMPTGDGAVVDVDAIANAVVDEFRTRLAS